MRIFWKRNGVAASIFLGVKLMAATLARRKTAGSGGRFSDRAFFGRGGEKKLFYEVKNMLELYEQKRSTS